MIEAIKEEVKLCFRYTQLQYGRDFKKS